MIRGASELGTLGISGGVMGIKSDAEQRKEKKRTKAAVRNELDKFNESNWGEEKNSGTELRDPSYWITVDAFAREQNVLQSDIDMLKQVQQDI